jgi:hypothetical protein
MNIPKIMFFISHVEKYGTADRPKMTIQYDAEHIHVAYPQQTQEYTLAIIIFDTYYVSTDILLARKRLVLIHTYIYSLGSFRSKN